ncbi:MAG: Ig-like domain-containing protein, partial [Desulfovibrio sp.]|uniref:Ig-like domain-containing protein n=1 Tax=Desulfovibrio sp. TaxID=885 RepID=UPI00135EFAE1
TADLRADHSIDAKVETFDTAGNPGSATATRTVDFDTTAPTAGITIGVIAGDDVLNNTEKTQTNTTIGGTVTGDVKVGDTVTLTVNNHTYTASVSLVSGAYVYQTSVLTSDLVADHSIDARIVVSDLAGNTTEALASRSVAVNSDPSAVADTNTIYQGDPVAHGNVLTNDTDADGNHLTVVGVTAGTATPGTAGVGTVISGTYGTITINSDGSYDYNLDNSNAAVKGLNGSSVTDTFSYKMTDGNGGYSTATVKVTINDSKYSVDTTNGDTTLNGGSGNDVLLGDQGGTSTTVVPGTSPTNYDVCIILDTSGSMGDSIGGTTRLALAQNALTNLLNDLKDHPGIVNIKLIGFSDTVNINVEALENSSKYQKDLATLFSRLSSAEADGGTNYEAAFTAAASWFTTNASDGYTKLAYFLSDGIPTARTVGNSVDYGNYYYGGSQMSQNEFTEALTQYNKLVSANVQVNAIGIGTGIDANVLKYFDNTPVPGGSVTNTTTTFNGSNYEDTFTYTGKAGAVSIVNSAAELKAALNAGTPDELLVNLVSVGKDTVNGGAGNDILFGDAVNANWLLQDTSWTSAGKAALNPGDSLGIVREYVLATSLNGTTLTGTALEAAINEAISRELTEHSMLYGLSETARGGADTLTGGDGNDMLFGQAGADILDGGAGHDMLVGGTGNDTLTGGTGADVFLFHSGSGADIITDYNSTDGDAIVRVGDAAAGDSIKNSSNVSIDTASNLHTVVDVQQGHSVTIIDSSNHLLVGSGVATDGHHYTSTDAPNVSFDNYLVGGSGDDVIYGGAGNNYLNGGAGNDHIIGGSGDSYLFGGDGNDRLYAGSGNDHLYGGAGDDTLNGGAGHDFLDGGAGYNTLSGGDGNDIMVYHSTDTISGGSGIDVLLTGNAGDNLSALLSSSSVNTMEVAIKGSDAAHANAPMSLTDLSKLAAVGINISDSTVNGQTVTTMTLAADKWTDTGDHHTFTNASANLTLNTNLTESHDSGSSTEVAKFILTNS